MRNNLRYYLILLLAAPLFFLGIDSFTRKIYADKINLNVNIKSYNSMPVSLFYNDIPLEFSLDKCDSKPLNASQFYKHLTFEVPEAKYIKFMRLDFGEEANQIFIESIGLTVKGAFKDTTIKTWTGKELQKLILLFHGAEMTSENNFYIQVASRKDDPYMVFNTVFHEQLQDFYKQNGTGRTTQLTATIVLTIFCLAMLFFILSSYTKRVSFKESVRGGAVLVAGAIGIVGFIFLNNKFHLVEDSTSQENRTLAAYPEMQLNNFFTFPDAYSNYAKDHFSFRNTLFYLHSVYMAKVFHTSPMPDDVMMGRNNWFFDVEPGCISDARRMTQVSNDDLSQIYVSMMEKKKWLDARHIKFYIIVPPNKQSVYPEMMPPGYFETKGLGTNRLEMYKLHLARHVGINLINPTEALMLAKKRREVYYKSDTHWNLYGGFIGYHELMKEICKDFPYLRPVPEEAFNITTFQTSEGDLARVTGLNELYKRTEQVMTFKDPKKELRHPHTSEIVIRFNDNPTIDSSNLKLLMLRDSYSNYLIPFINLHFKNALYLWSYDFPDKVIEEEKPDVVIFESLQRFMAGAFANPNPESMKDSTILIKASGK